MNLVKTLVTYLEFFNGIYGILISTFHIITNFLTGLGFLVILALKSFFEFLPLLITFLKTPWHHINDTKIKIPENVSIKHMYILGCVLLWNFHPGYCEKHVKVAFKTCLFRLPASQFAV